MMTPAVSVMTPASEMPPAICFLPTTAQQLNVKPKRIRLFIKPYCGWCHKAMRWLNDQGVQYETIDVTSDETAMAEMVRLSGGEMSPVIDVGGRILADFGPEQLAEFWEQIEKL
jgi:glutaredoxin 3